MVKASSTGAANGSDGFHQRDFVFHVVKIDGVLYVGANNGSTFAPDLVELPGSVEVTESGWYTLQHVFNEEGGVLSVDMNLVSEAGVVLRWRL